MTWADDAGDGPCEVIQDARVRHRKFEDHVIGIRPSDRRGRIEVLVVILVVPELLRLAGRDVRHEERQRVAAGERRAVQPFLRYRPTFQPVARDRRQASIRRRPCDALRQISLGRCRRLRQDARPVFRRFRQRIR